MVRYIAIVFTLVLSSLVSDAPERIAWEPERQLKWSDFKGKPDRLYRWAASSSTGLSQSFEMNNSGVISKSSVEVKAHFYTEYSWYKKDEASAKLLRHEQTHFDITELHARLLRKKIARHTFTSNSKVEIQQLYSEVEKDRVKMQEQFDRDTNHSLDTASEMVWELKVTKLLDRADRYPTN